MMDRMLACVEEPAHRIPVKGEYEVVVAGAGAGGLAAALAAARLGRRVLLVDKAILLGGLATQGLINWLEPYCDGKGDRLLGGIPWELFNLALRYGYDSLPDNWGGTGNGPKSGRLASWFSPEIFMLSVEKLLLDAGVELLLDTRCVFPLMEDKRCRGVITESVEGRCAIRADMVIDATGSCELFAKAGAPTVDGENYLAIRAYGTDLRSIEEAAQKGRAYLARRRLRCGATLSGKGHPQGVPLVAGTTAREVTDFVLASHRMLFEEIVSQDRLERDVITLPHMAQLRTIRHIAGARTFTGEEDRVFQEDSIGAIPDFYYPGRAYELPYGCLYAENMDGLLTCGRTISASGWGWHASRVLGAAFLTGQAAGTAAHLALQQGCAPQELPIVLLQDRLERDGVRLHI